jgi:DNA mismatch repair protein MutS
MTESTPMMAQYRMIKERFADSILFFRLGDFYEMFEKDAREVSSLLDLTLTQRAGVPMCGIPYHAASPYIARLLAAGKKIAICEQTSGPGKGLMSREVVEVISPGTVLDESCLTRNANSYLLAVGRVGDAVALAYADLSTGEFAATSFPFAQREARLAKELHRLEPREVITQESFIVEDEVARRLFGEREGLLVNRYPDWIFALDACRDRLQRQLGVANLKGFGLRDDSPEIVAAGVVLEYLGETAKRTLDHISSLSVYTESSFVELDEPTQRNLELLCNLQDGSRKYSLLEVLDQTRTAPGARKLRRWILTPLKDRDAIEKRLSAVEALYREQVLLARLRDVLGRVFDLERLTARVALERAHAKDLLAVRATIETALDLARLLGEEETRGAALAALAAPIRERSAELSTLVGLLQKAIDEEPAIGLAEGKLIRRGYDGELDRLHSLADNARDILEKYLEEERSATGIGSLKMRYNRIIGYFLEVTKSNLPLVPARFIRRQSLVGGERYTTDRLADIESEINDASERIVEIERRLFLEVRARVRAEVPRLLEVCEAVSELDVLQAFAFTATVHGYARPAIREDLRLEIRNGRHPVVEAHLPGGSFVPNSVHCDGAGNFFVIITGPNMAGKSTFLRQTALITLMAQIGSFVPAEEATVGIVDSIFCRVGATDNLARGESTFLVEMNETAHILRAATRSSLIIMDEIGRGTSTQDGLAIAWAVSMYILERICARTLFATHFHELTGLAHARATNLSMEVLEREGEIVFLKKVREGPSNNSYGIHVAKLAGLPAETLQYAERMLAEMGSAGKGGGTTFPPPAHPVKPPLRQQELFSAEQIVIHDLLGMSPENTTPLEALRRIARWRDELQREKAGGESEGRNGRGTSSPRGDPRE